MTGYDWAALALFAGVWIFYEQILRGVSRHSLIATDMTVVRMAWMRAMANREMRLVDSQLMGHAINSASFFASANLILIAAVAGALFGGAMTLQGLSDLGVDARSGSTVEAKLALVTVCLARGFLDFIWSIRQMNYALALIGAAPEADGDREAFARATAEVLNPALSSFSQGVRGYYFALASAAWLFGPLAFVAATVASFALLIWRQSRSRASRGVRQARALLEAAERNDVAPHNSSAVSDPVPDQGKTQVL